MKRITRLVLAVALVGLLPGVAEAQTVPEVEIVNVNTARYSEGGRVTMVVEFRNLSAPIDPSELVVTENGAPVENVEITPIRSSRVPVGVVLVIDVSGSMQGEPLEAAKAAAKTFVSQKRPEDFVALVTFNDEVTVVSSFTTSAGTLNERIDALEASNSTALYDAVVRAAELYAGSTSALRRNMIVLSDGSDQASTATKDDAIASLQAFDVRAFGVGLESPEFDPDPLREIVEAADGIFLSTPDPQELSSLYGQIQRELDNTLVLRFSATENRPTEVEFGVSYAGGLADAATVEVEGYVTTTTAGPTTTTTFAMAQPSVVQSRLPVDRDTLVLGAAAAIGITTALFLYILLGGGREDGESAFARRLAAYGRRTGTQEEKKPFLQRIPLLSRFTQRAEEEARRRGLLHGINSALEQGNIPLAAGEAVAAAIGISAVVGLLVGVATVNLVAGAVGFGVMILAMFALINWAGSREKKRFEDQLPDTLTLISTSLRAGYSLLQAVEAVAAEAPNPTAREFGRALAEARLGRPVTEALAGISERVQSEDFEWAVMAIEIQREVGGNLAEVLQTVADTMLARNRLRGEIKALTAEGRISAWVLGALPFVMAAFLWVTNRSYLQPLFESTFGLVSIGVGLGLMAAGILWLRKIVNIEV